MVNLKLPPFHGITGTIFAKNAVRDKVEKLPRLNFPRRINEIPVYSHFRSDICPRGQSDMSLQ